MQSAASATQSAAASETALNPQASSAASAPALAAADCEPSKSAPKPCEAPVLSAAAPARIPLLPSSVNNTNLQAVLHLMPAPVASCGGANRVPPAPSVFPPSALFPP